MTQVEAGTSLLGVSKKPNNASPKYKFLDNKLTDFKELIWNEIDTCLIFESKLGNNFENTQFQAEGYSLFRKERNKFGGGIILLVKENFPEKVINSHKFPAGIEIICFEYSICNFILTNKISLFISSTTFKNGLSDFHKVTTFMLRKTIVDITTIISWVRHKGKPVWVHLNLKTNIIKIELIRIGQISKNDKFSCYLPFM